MVDNSDLMLPTDDLSSYSSPQVQQRYLPVRSPGIPLVRPDTMVVVPCPGFVPVFNLSMFCACAALLQMEGEARSAPLWPRVGSDPPPAPDPAAS
jgi:hypothetical protein